MLHPELVDLVDDLATGLMLSQLVYWFTPAKSGKPKLQVEQGGRRWMTRTYREWHETCRISERQCRRSVKLLTEMGLIEVQFRMINRVLTPHVWLDLSRLEFLLLKGSRSETGVVTKRDGGGHETYGPLKLETKRDYEEQSLAADAAPALKPVLVSSTEREGIGKTAGKMLLSGWDRAQIRETLGQSLEPGWEMKADEILAKTRPGNNGNTVMSLEMLWKRNMALLETGFVKNLTNKERGQLKLLMQGCGEDARAVVDWATQHWTKFCISTMQQKGLSTTPDSPVVGFLLQYHDVAMNLAKVPPEPVCAESVPPPVQSIAKPEPIPDNADQELVPDMLAKWLAAKGGG